jgi:5-(carboxyamino)imidazole ribonucleotide synthase
MNEKLTPFLPSAKPETWLGVMGGGQLGRMFAHAAQKMGYKVAVLEPAKDCPAGDSADHLLSADYTDPAALAELAEQCVAVTTEFENVPADSLSFLSQRTFVAPCARAVSIAQDRVAEKRFFNECGKSSGVMPAPYHEVNNLSDIDTIPDHLFPGILKTVRLGYDGKGQVRVNSAKEALVAYVALQEVPCVLEKMLPLAYEISVLSARGADGQAVVYPIAENVHVDGILFTTTVPSPHVAAETAAKAQAATLEIINQIGYVGVLCIEFFVLKDGSLVVNEMAPRPHNSGHYTIDACVTSQFAQQARAMARLPLGDVRQHSPAVMLNILGDLWYDGDTDQLREPEWDKVLALPGANLHLYGKDEPRRGRKMGHVTFVAPTLEEAQESMRVACDILGIPLDE